MTRMLRFSLKFCTAIECPAPISTWPRCCSSAFIGTTKKPASAPISTMTLPAISAALLAVTGPMVTLPDRLPGSSTAMT